MRYLHCRTHTARSHDRQRHQTPVSSSDPDTELDAISISPTVRSLCACYGEGPCFELDADFVLQFLKNTGKVALPVTRLLMLAIKRCGQFPHSIIDVTLLCNFHR